MRGENYQGPDISTENALRLAGKNRESFVAFESIRELEGFTDSTFSLGPQGARPASGVLGDRYLASDIGTRGGWLYYWTGLAWEIVVGWASGTDAVRAAITVSAIDDGAWFYASDTKKLWEVVGGVWMHRETVDVMIGDTGSGGVKGLAPAPAAGDAAAGKFLNADGTYAVPGSASPTIVTHTGTTYTLDPADKDKIHYFANAAAITVTVPAGLGLFSILWAQTGAGQITFVPSSTTVNNRQAHTKSAGQWAAGGLLGEGDVLILTGDTAA